MIETGVSHCIVKADGILTLFVSESFQKFLRGAVIPLAGGGDFSLIQVLQTLLGPLWGVGFYIILILILFISVLSIKMSRKSALYYDLSGRFDELSALENFAFLITDFKGRILSGNDTACYLYRRNKVSLSGCFFGELLDSQNRLKAESWIKSVVAGNAAPRDFYHISREGVAVAVSAFGIPVLYKNKKRLLLIISDIKRFYRPHYHSRVSGQNRYIQLFENALCAAIIQESSKDKFHITDVNKAAVRFLGFSAEELKKMNLKDFLCMDSAVFEELHEFGSVFSNIPVKVKDGRQIPSELSLNTYPISGGIRTVVCFMDISGKLETEEALSSSEIRFKELTDMLPECILETDTTLKIIYGNLKACSLLGISAEGVPVSCLDIVLPQERERLKEDFKKNVCQGAVEYTVLRSDGFTFPALFNLTPVFRYDRLCGYYCIIIDLTAQKRIQEEKWKLEEMLHHSRRLETLGTLTGGIAHDFNNILAPVMGYTDMALLKMDKENPLYRDLEKVLEGAVRARDMISRLLLFSKQEEGFMGACLLSSVIEDVLSSLTLPPNVELNTLIDESCPPAAGEAFQISQVVVNLIDNSLLAMAPHGGVLGIQLSLETCPWGTGEKCVRLMVSDTGCGMEEAVKERIFEPFFTTRSVGKGVGLGLSVVHGIVKRHKGKISVFSKPGEGCRVDIFLNVYEAREESFPPRSAKHHNHRVMIVDEDVNSASSLCEMLRNLGYESEIFYTSPSALKAFTGERQRYSLLMVDLTMPLLHGFELADEFFRIERGFPVVLMTGYEKSIPGTFLKENIRVIKKPVKIKDLEEKIMDIFNRGDESEYSGN